MAKYLYGASIQGIQEYIYATNDLQEIIGASEIIDSLGRNLKDKKKDDGEIFGMFDELKQNGLVEQILLNAAGNFRAIVNGEENLKKIVYNLPKKIMQNAYGITVSQATAPYNGDYETASKILEQRLKTQRNRPSLPLDMSINFMLLAPKTARAVYKIKNKKDEKILLDISSAQKREAHTRWFNKRREKDKEDKKDVQFIELKEFSQILNDKNKLAIIHADGNGLGILVKNLVEVVKKNNDTGAIARFSESLDKATKNAFAKAKEKTKAALGKNSLKIKELILSGDDMTAVCDADIALEFTKNFIEEFENQTDNKKPDIEQKLTMCAGIAYCNEKFPFHYAVALAEELCAAAKKHSKSKYVKDQEKDIAPSCLMFHNIQSSNFQSWDNFIKDELTIKNKGNNIRCDFGPYYLKKDGEANIDAFINLAKIYSDEKSPKGKLREWIKELGINENLAKMMLDRINDMLENRGKFDKTLDEFYKGLSCKNLIIEKDQSQKTPIYDLLQILSVTYGLGGKNDNKL